MNAVEAIFLLHSADCGSVDLLDAVECLLDLGEEPLVDEVLENRFPLGEKREYDTSRFRQAKYDSWAGVWDGPTTRISSGRRVLPRPDADPGSAPGFSSSPETWGLFAES